MKECTKTYYKCEICGREYDEPTNAQTCEKSHCLLNLDHTNVEQKFRSFFDSEQYIYPSALTIHHNKKKIVYTFFAVYDENGCRDI